MDAVAVVIPIHDEAKLLPHCLDALVGALTNLSPALLAHVVLVLDACRDDSPVIADRWARARGHSVLEVDFMNVGRARGIGMARAVEFFSEIAPDRLWLTTTDADSVVPPSWLLEQLQLASQGFDAFAGGIEVNDWSEYPAGFGRRFVAFYESMKTAAIPHHIHGANMGLRADAYLASGGFEPLTTGEDQALWSSLRRRAFRCIGRREPAVITSARKHGRAPSGFSAFLVALQNSL